MSGRVHRIYVTRTKFHFGKDVNKAELGQYRCFHFEIIRTLTFDCKNTCMLSSYGVTTVLTVVSVTWGTVVVRVAVNRVKVEVAVVVRLTNRVLLMVVK